MPEAVLTDSITRSQSDGLANLLNGKRPARYGKSRAMREASEIMDVALKLVTRLLDATEDESEPLLKQSTALWNCVRSWQVARGQIRTEQGKPKAYGGAVRLSNRVNVTHSAVVVGNGATKPLPGEMDYAPRRRIQAKPALVASSTPPVVGVITPSDAVTTQEASR